MKTEDTVEYNSLRWVKKELDLILHEAQASLSAFIEDTDESDRLRECIEHLHMVQGTLQMVELYGAAQLAEEMEHVATALLNGELDKKDDAYDVLMRSMLQLPDYLESLQAGSKDVPMVLLPLLNDLRASRNASLLSENVLFFPDIDATTEDIVITDVEAGKLLGVARKLRPHFQIGLLGWFKGEKINASLKRILAVLSELEKNSANRATRRLWSISAALVEGLVSDGIDSSVSVKMLLGQVDRNIRKLIDVGEDEFSRLVPSELLKNLLYYVARVDGESDRIKQVKETYRLAELLPGDNELEEARSGLGGLNTELLRTVSQGIREDLLEVKDALEIFAHSESRDTDRLGGLPDLLNKIADTLAMLGLGGPREQVLEQKRIIERMVSGGSDTIDDDVMNIAGELLTVEAQLNNFIANRSVAESSSVRKRVGDLGDMPEGEYHEVLSAVIREALQDFSDARQAILGYLENNNDKDLLDIVLRRLTEVNGAMFMLPVQRIKPQIDSINQYVRRVLLGAGQVPDQQAQDNLADVVTSIEYYLEAVLEGRPDLEMSLGTGEKAAQFLDNISSSFEDIAEPVQDTDEQESAGFELPVEEELEEAAEESPVTAPEAASASVTQAPAEQASSAEEQRYQILGDDADPEILEIFIEEALEELASLNEQIPLWSSNPDNTDALTTIRRSFHTLKGSGRLIGAELIGEFSWNFENMLNRVIDKSRPASQEVFDLLEEALGVLPQLIEQLKGNREPVSQVYKLMNQADVLSHWRKTEPGRKSAPKPAPAPAPAPEIAEQVEEPAPSTPQAEIEMEAGTEDGGEDISFDGMELLSDADFDIPDEDELLFEAAAENEVDLDDFSMDAGDDNFDIDLTDDLEALQLAISPDDDEQEEISFDMDEPELNEADSDVAESPQIHMDPVLFKIFRGESESHLSEMGRMLDMHHRGEQKLTANSGLTRALHTLFGSARTAEVDEIAELCGELEKYVRLYQDRDDPSIEEDGVQLIGAVASKVGEMLEDMQEPGMQLRSDMDLLSRIKSLIQKVSEQNMAAEAQLAPAPSPAVAETAPKTSRESLVSYSEVDEELVDIFLEEAEELIDGCENSLQRWNSNNADGDAVHDLQRQLHTLKGGARMADLTPIGDLTHALESLIISVNEGQNSFNKDMSYILHDAMDRLSDMLAKVKSREPISSEERMIAAIEAMRRGETVDVKKSEEPAEAQDKTEQSISLEDITSIEFEEEDELDLTAAGDQDYTFEITDDQLADDMESIQLDQPETGAEEELEFEISQPEQPKPARPEHEKTAEVKPQEKPGKSTLELPREKATATEQEEKSTIAHEQVRVRSDLLNELVNHAGEVSVYHARMGQQITDFSFNLSEMAQTVVRLREQLRKLSIETEAQILSRYEKESDQYDRDFDPLEMDRFSTMQQISRSLQETVGDIESIKDILKDGVRDAETLLLQESRVSSDLQEGLMRTRMVHFGGLASRLRRIVRQTARELDKDVELDISGETSEVDRTVLDRIIAPLEHMLRNAVSHGIEAPRDRAGKGKPETGTIKIMVDREGGDVVIKVVDDGRGIDVNAVRARATERGLLDPNSKLSDHDVLQFIMQAGFSTAEKVTQISGRGVGMDVVDSEIKQLGGVLEIDTIQGKGTTFVIRLPLTLAINHALLVSAGEEMYAIPLNSIEGVVRLSGIELQAFYDSGDSAYEFAGTQYDLRHLGYLLSGVQPNYSKSGQLFPVLLAHIGDQRVAIHVDELLGRREIVVKPVGPQISSVRGVSGATILGDGRVVLILEMNALVLGEALFHVTEAAEAEQKPYIPEVIQERHEPVVMVVDDSITIRKVTERMLARHNMQVVTAKDGVDAVSQLQDIKPDIMLLDIEMPRMDGYEVASHVRNDDRLKDLPIIMITSRTGTKHREKAMEIGVNKYLGKPYQEDELMQNINELLG
jgi:chemosensory pili system protein ChpA (sensor histidine kinase/response regulator)